MGTGMVWWGIVSTLLWLGLAALVVWALLRWLAGTRSLELPSSREMPTLPGSALDILKTRYARGEIDTPTFQAMRVELEAADAAARSTPADVA